MSLQIKIHNKVKNNQNEEMVYRPV